MASAQYKGYMNILAAGVYGAELLTLGTGFVTILRGHDVTEEMDWLYLLNVVKIFIISGYLLLQCCWRPVPEQNTCNRLVLGGMSFATLGSIIATIIVTIFEISRNVDDENENNDYLIYIVAITCLFQTLLLAFYTYFFIRYMLEVEAGKSETMIEAATEDKTVQQILHRMSK